MRSALALAWLGTLLFASPAAAWVQFDAEYDLPAHGETLLVDGHSVPCLADLNGDGDVDLLVGEGSGLIPGRVRLYLNEGLGDPPSFGDWSYLESTGGVIEYEPG